MIKRAQDRGAIEIRIHNLRKWTNDKHRSVDDKPYGGGAGMIMKIEPLLAALDEIRIGISGRQKTILFSASGKLWTQNSAAKAVGLDHLIMICGRYEGVDGRIRHFINQEISIGRYVLTGGEIPAMVVVDSIARLLPDVLGNPQSNKDESFSCPGFLEYPQFTRPEILKREGKSYTVPSTLLSGNHKEVEEWRKKNARGSRLKKR